MPENPRRPRLLVVLGRVLRVRCPACGVGRLFEHALSSARRFRGARRCASCDWWLERGPGHWVGGTEVNVVATYAIAVPLFSAVVVYFGVSVWTLGATALFTALLPLAAYRHSRALFFGLDYLIDPTPDPSEGGDDRARDGGEPREPAPPHPVAPCRTPGPTRRRPARERDAVEA